MKEENIKGEYQRKVDKSLIPTCNIMGVNIAAINMNWLLKYLDANLSDTNTKFIWNAMIRGKYKIRQEQVRFLQEMPSEENLWKAVIAFQEYPFKTATGLPFRFVRRASWNQPGYADTIASTNKRGPLSLIKHVFGRSIL